MYEFMELVRYMWELVMKADTFAREACENKHDHPDLAAAYFRLSSDMLTDFDIMKKQAEMYVDEAEKAQHEDLDKMDCLWSVDHPRLMDEVHRVKVRQEMYR